MTSERDLIVTVTLNAAVDKTYRVENFGLDRVHRPSEEKTVAGGKGINVARVLKELGQEPLATGYVGGANGRIITSGLHSESIPYDFISVNGESRLCIAVVDPINRTQTEVNEIGPAVGPDELGELRRKLAELVHGADYLVISGSAPPGVPDDFYAEAIGIARTAGVKTVLDASGDHLRQGVKAMPFMVKPNEAELSALVGRELLTFEEIIGAAKDLAQTGIPIVVVSLGRSGGIITDGRRAWQAKPPEIEFVSAVGSGDAMVAATLDAFIRGADLPECLRVGTAAGAANASTYGAGFVTKDQIWRLLEGVVVEELD